MAAHFAYISRRGALEIETDEGERIGRPEEQKRLLDDWHLELTAGQYRRQVDGGPARRPTKLVHNIVLSMPAPTHRRHGLAAARNFARQKFAQHRYAMVLHTDQKHPHVHLVVKAENELGRRLHIDKQLLRDWREDFARLMREQGIAANATPRAVRGENKKKPWDGIFKAQRYGKSTALHDRVIGIAQELSRSEDSCGSGARKVARYSQIAGINLDEGRRGVGCAGGDDPRWRRALLCRPSAARPHGPAKIGGATHQIHGKAASDPTGRSRARLPQGPGADAVGLRGYSHEKHVEKSICVQS